MRRDDRHGLDSSRTGSPARAPLHSSSSGTGTSVSATIDPTVLPNGAYELVIRRATSSDGGVTLSETSFVVDGQLKPGPLPFLKGFDDMSVGVAGLPVRVIRRYDSFDKGSRRLRRRMARGARPVPRLDERASR